MRALMLATATFGLALATPAMAAVSFTPGATEGSSTDLFEGATASSSNLLGGFTAADAFGAVTSNGPYAESLAGGHVIFDGNMTLPVIYFSTTAPITIAGFIASVSSDGVGNPFRGFSDIALYAYNSATTSYDFVASSGAYDPSLGGLTIGVTFAPITAQDFAFAAIDTNGGGRLIELDAIAAVPEPATWAMMIGGFGLVGGVLRRRKSVRTSVTYA